MHKPNNIVEHDVKDELDWDPLLDNSRIVVKASDGEVTLTGAVPTYYESVLAGAATVGRIS
jgi:osmotically-inducible protein OsmY